MNWTVKNKNETNVSERDSNLRHHGHHNNQRCWKWRHFFCVALDFFYFSIFFKFIKWFFEERTIKRCFIFWLIDWLFTWFWSHIELNDRRNIYYLLYWIIHTRWYKFFCECENAYHSCDNADNQTEKVQRFVPYYHRHHHNHHHYQPHCVDDKN